MSHSKDTSVHLLQTLLQFQLATDLSAPLHLHYVLNSLSKEHFAPSSHLQRWTSRINALLRSKEPAARWAGLCIAHRTSILSKPTMIENAQSWLTVALPIASKSEPVPVIKASVRLVTHIFTAAIGTPEFQRQVSTPNVVKYSQTLAHAIETHSDVELKVLALGALRQLIVCYPALHKVLHVSVTDMTMRLLNGAPGRPPDAILVAATARLFSTLHLTGGKVGAANLWRKAINEILMMSWNALHLITSTIQHEGQHLFPLHSPLQEEPLFGIPFNLERLKCGTVLLCELLNAPSTRPINLPIVDLLNLVSALLTCTAEDETMMQNNRTDSTVRTMEVSVLPAVWGCGCEMLSCLAICAGHHLSPHSARIISFLSYHLEQRLASCQSLSFWRATKDCLQHSLTIDSSLIMNRLAKATLPRITAVLSANTASQAADASTSPSKGKKSKHKNRGYEGDEIFRQNKETIFPTCRDGEVVLAAVDVMSILLNRGHLDSSVHSTVGRIVLSTLLALPLIEPSSLSPDLSLHKQLLAKLQAITMRLGASGPSRMSTGLGLVIEASGSTMENFIPDPTKDVQNYLELLIHPRLPPLLRPLPHVEALSFFRAEESRDELAIRESLALSNAGIVSHEQESGFATTFIEAAEAAPQANPLMSERQSELERPVELTSPVKRMSQLTTVDAVSPPKPVVGIPVAAMSHPSYLTPQNHPRPAGLAKEPRSTIEDIKNHDEIPKDAPSHPANPTDAQHVFHNSEGEEDGVPTINMDSDSD